MICIEWFHIAFAIAYGTVIGWAFTVAYYQNRRKQDALNQGDKNV